MGRMTEDEEIEIEMENHFIVTVCYGGFCDWKRENQSHIWHMAVAVQAV